jgi:hypothetical protein
MRPNFVLGTIVSVLLGTGLQGCALLGFNQSDDESRDEIAQESVQNALARRDVVKGMDMVDVRQVLGTPTRVEVAGNTGESADHQRWTYFHGLTRGVSRAQVIYFENGKVIGWETLRP